MTWKLSASLLWRWRWHWELEAIGTQSVLLFKTFSAQPTPFCVIHLRWLRITGGATALRLVGSRNRTVTGRRSDVAFDGRSTLVAMVQKVRRIRRFEEIVRLVGHCCGLGGTVCVCGASRSVNCSCWLLLLLLLLVAVGCLVTCPLGGGNRHTE